MPVLYWRAGVLCYAVLSVLAGTCTTVPCGTACTGRNFDGVLQCYAVLFVLAGGRAASGGGWMTARRAANTCVRNQRQLHTRSVHFVPGMSVNAINFGIQSHAEFGPRALSTESFGRIWLGA